MTSQQAQDIPSSLLLACGLNLLELLISRTEEQVFQERNEQKRKVEAFLAC
jgi:hypothetical protein